MADEDEFTGRETERQDCVDNAIHNMLEEVSRGKGVEWDIEYIAEVRDTVQRIFVDVLGTMTEQEFYPYRELDDDGNIVLEPSEPEQKEMIITDEQMVIAMKQQIEDIDADELAVMAGDWLGGLCWYTNDGLYSFIPDERYCGGLDFTEESNGN